MKVGTKSLLWGCHQFVIHPVFVLVAWVELYRPDRPLRFALNPGRVAAAIVHDWGYWGCETMDGPDGELHPTTGASIMLHLTGSLKWRDEVLFHSRYLAAKWGQAPSNFCWVDKWATSLYPSWLWAVLAKLSGEGREYMGNGKYEIHIPGDKPTLTGLVRFHRRMRRFFSRKLRGYGFIVRKF
jgi:hypothetical protein